MKTNLLPCDKGISIRIQIDTGLLFLIGRYDSLRWSHQKFRTIYIGKRFVVRYLCITGCGGTSGCPDGMNCNSIFLIIPGEVNMYLTSHLRHTVDKAALDRISKVFYIRGIIIFRINMEMHPDTISRTLFYRSGDAHTENMRILLRRTEYPLPPAQFISPYKFSFYRLILYPCDNGTDPPEAYLLCQTEILPGSHFPFKGFLRKDFLFSAQTIILVHILDLCKLFIAQDIFFPQIRNSKIGPSMRRTAVRYHKGMKMTGKTHEEIPVALLILKQEIRNHSSFGSTVQNFRILLILKDLVHNLPVCCV